MFVSTAQNLLHSSASQGNKVLLNVPLSYDLFPKTSDTIFILPTVKRCVDRDL